MAKDRARWVIYALEDNGLRMWDSTAYVHKKANISSQ